MSPRFAARVVLVLIGIAGGLMSASTVSAQGFSGSDISNYRCPVFPGLELVNDTVIAFEGRFVCQYRREFNNGSSELLFRDAIPKPPALRVIEIWFVRILYLIWGFSGIVFTGLLIWLGFKYMTSFGNEVAIAEVIKDFRKWLIGLALIFLSYPALSTFFRILPISQTECYADLSLPGFQFFFPTACSSRENQCRELYSPDSPDYEQCLTAGN